eukprot:2447044-Prymnesium_polylepis.1
MAGSRGSGARGTPSSRPWSAWWRPAATSCSSTACCTAGPKPTRAGSAARSPSTRCCWRATDPRSMVRCAASAMHPRGPRCRWAARASSRRSG